MKQEEAQKEQEQAERMAKLLDAMEDVSDKELADFVMLASKLRSLKVEDRPYDSFKSRLGKQLSEQAKYQKLSLMAKVGLFFKNIIVSNNPYSKFSAAMQPAVARVSMLALVAIAVVVGWQQFGNVSIQEGSIDLADATSSQQHKSLFQKVFKQKDGFPQTEDAQKDEADEGSEVAIANAAEDTSVNGATTDQVTDEQPTSSPTAPKEASPQKKAATPNTSTKEKKATFSIAAQVTVEDAQVDSTQTTRVPLGGVVSLTVVAQGDTTGIEYQFEDAGSGFGSVLQSWSLNATLQWQVNKNKYLEKDVAITVRARKQTPTGLETQETVIAYYVYNPNDEVVLMDVTDSDGLHQTNSQAEEGTVNWSGSNAPQKAHKSSIAITVTPKIAKYTPLEYRFIVENATGSRTIEQDWSANAVFSYTISNYTFVGQQLKIEVQVRDNNSSYRYPARGADDYTQVSYLVYNTDTIIKYVKDAYTNTQTNSQAEEGTVAWSQATPNAMRSVGDLIAMYTRTTDPDEHDQITFRFIFEYEDGTREVVRNWAIQDDLADTFAPEKARGQRLIVEVQTKDQNGVLRYPDRECDDWTQVTYEIAE